MRTYIKAVAYCLPEKVVTNEDLSTLFPEWPAEKIASKVGVKERHIADDYETAVDLACIAANRLFEKNSVSKLDIDYIIFCTQSPDYFLPTSACIIQNKLGIPTSCGAFDFNLGCSGYIYGLSIAKGLIFGGIAKNILLLTAETYSKYIHPEDKSNRTIFGDGASATLVSADGFAEILDFCLGTDGSGADDLIVKTGGMRHRDNKNDLIFDDASGNPFSSDHLYMNGKAIFDFTADAVPKLVEELLKKNSLKKKDIDLFIFHQANKYMINYLRKLIEIDKDKFFEYMELVGNTVSSSIPISICEAQSMNRLHGKILLAGFGVGFSWGGVILNC